MTVYTALGVDTDCDGTSYFAKRVEAATKEDVFASDTRGDFYDVLPEDEFLAKFESLFRGDDRHHIDLTWELNYYKKEGYCTLGASWNVWVYDDSIGIPALDHTHDE